MHTGHLHSFPGCWEAHCNCTGRRASSCAPQAQGDLMNVANAVANNLAHLKPPTEEKHIGHMY